MTVGWFGFTLLIVGFLLLAITRREVGLAIAVVIAGTGLGLLLSIILISVYHWRLM